jgi:GT2 family glycosyltransferase
MDYPLFSVITPTLNQGRYIEQCIRSVLAQNYPAFEHIVIDGGSTDETLDVLKRFSHVKWISEKDSGQSDALNKALRMARGGVIAWLNSDDYYLPGAFENVREALKLRPDAAVVVGNTLLHHQNTSLITSSQNRPLDFEDLLRYWDEWIPPTQPSVFFTAEAAREAGADGPDAETGPFDTTLHYAMDYDLWLRIAKKHRFYFIPRTLAVYRMHGASKSGYEEWTPFFPEYNAVYRRHKGHSKLLPAGPLVTVAIPFSKALLARSAWHANAVRFTVENFQSQKIRDIEILVVTDVETPESFFREAAKAPIPTRFIKIPRLDDRAFFGAVCGSASGMALHCPSLEAPLNFQRFAACLTKLIKEPGAQAVIDTETPDAAHPYLPPGGPLGPNLYMRRAMLAPFEAFEFPECKTPEVSIIVTVRAERLTAYNCLKKLRETTGDIPVEVVLVVEETDKEDGWDAENPLSLVENIRTIKTVAGGVSGGDIALIRAINEAARTARGGIIALIDCDVMAATGWLTALTSVFENMPDAGAACGMLLYPDGPIRDAGGIVFDTGAMWSYGSLDDPGKSEYNFTREVDFCTRSFMAVRREVFMRTGGFDETIEPEYAAAGLSLAMRKAGFKTIYTPAARVFHFGADAFLEKPWRPGAETLNHGVPKNNAFRARWAGRLRCAKHPQAGELIHRAHSLGKKAEALIVTGGPLSSAGNTAENPGANPAINSTVNPAGSIRGDAAARNPNIVRDVACAFVECGANVTLYLDADASTPDLGPAACGIEITGARGRLSDFLSERKRQYDVIWLSGRDVSFGKADAALEPGIDALVVYDAIDLRKNLDGFLNGGPDKSGRKSGHDTGLLNQIYFDEELYICNIADMVVVPDDESMSCLAKEPGIDAAKLVPAVWDLADARKIVSLAIELAKKGLKPPVNVRALSMELKKRIFENRKKALVSACGEGRPVYIWGTGAGGATMLMAMRALGVEVEGFIDPDCDKFFHGSGKAVHPPSILLEKTAPVGSKRPYVVIGSLYGPIIRARLKSMGYGDITDTYTNIFL